MSKDKKDNGHRPATLEDLQDASDQELIEGIGQEEAEYRHLSEAELQRRMNQKVVRLNRRFWMMAGLLFVMNTFMIAAAYLLLRPRIDEDAVNEQVRDLMDTARDYANRSVGQASVIGSVAAERGRDYADLARDRGGKYADVALERGGKYADVAAQRGSQYATVGVERAKKEMASLR